MSSAEMVTTATLPPAQAAAAGAALPAYLLALRSVKVSDYHLTRKAIVYIRQSSPQQVVEHKESRARQYALVELAMALGWPRDRVEVIDTDQGHSAKTTAGRPGFHYILAELGLDHVGIILSLEASRLARSDPDWAPLVRMCGLFRTLLADYDGLYDPTEFNDRLLLGLKGIMSEAELHFLRCRMHEGRLNKARRGELFCHASLGYVRVPGGGLAIDPDEQVQSVVRLLFDQFERQGSLHGLLRYLVQHGMRIPVRPHHGPNRGQLEWGRPNRYTLRNLLHHPLYAGYYRHGHRPIDPRRQVPGRPATGRTIRKPQDCAVLLEGRCPAYISVERFWANQERLAANRARANAAGVVRHGPSLLGGVLVCGRCGQRLMVNYGGRGGHLRYLCSRAQVVYGEPVCQGLAGAFLDDLVATQVVAALTPAALELSLAAADDLQQQRGQEHQHGQQHLERARYQAERARRQYDAIEPENRLVARELERRWEEALQEQRRVEEEYARLVRSQPLELSASDREQIRSLAENVPALWAAPTTTAADRQRIIRLLVEEVIVAVDGTSERTSVTIRWVGGHTSRHELVRGVQCYRQLSQYTQLCNRLDQLRTEQLSLSEIAARLNQEGFRPPKRSQLFKAGMIGRLLAKSGRSDPRPRALAERGLLDESEWLLSDLARKLGMPQTTLHRWVRAGWVQARKLLSAGGHWVIWADADELARMSQLRTCPRGWSKEPVPAKLTKPKLRDNN
jgi:DNA invertase Pin-like site-specific DNA recombinase